MKPVVMAVDPGPHTGVAVRMPDGSYITNMIERDNEEFYALVKDLQPTAVIVERFAAALISKWGLQTVELVGAIKGICWVLGIPLIERTPQQRRAWMLDAEKLLQMQKLNGGGRYTQHNIDALAHLMSWEACVEV